MFCIRTNVTIQIPTMKHRLTRPISDLSILANWHPKGPLYLFRLHNTRTQLIPAFPEGSSLKHAHLLSLAKVTASRMAAPAVILYGLNAGGWGNLCSRPGSLSGTARPQTINSNTFCFNEHTKPEADIYDLKSVHKKRMSIALSNDSGRTILWLNTGSSRPWIMISNGLSWLGKWTKWHSSKGRCRNGGIQELELKLLGLDQKLLQGLQRENWCRRRPKGLE